jgi:hypothetical protein
MAKATRNNEFRKAVVVDRRQLLASAAVVVTASIVPTIEQTEAAGAAKVVQVPEAQELEDSACHFSTVTALRLREIAERNRLREEAGLPLLSMPKELRRMKEAADTEKFRKFAEVHRRRVYEKMLSRVRRRSGDPNWTATGMLSGGGFWFSVQVDEQMRKLYRRCTRRAAERGVFRCPQAKYIEDDYAKYSRTFASNARGLYGLVT